MLKELNDCNWGEVFGEGSGGNCSSIQPNRAPQDRETSIGTFSREDVKKLYGQSDGENDEQSWVCWGKLKDGRWFVARGDCDYTGWDCRASNSGDVASSKKDIIRFGLDDNERSRFNLTI